MKYIFFIIAILIQPIFAYSVYHKQDKNQAALKVPMMAYSAVYLVVQFYVYFKYLIKFPEDYQNYSYLIQGGILAVFIVIELLFFSSNKYINRIDAEKKEKISDFRAIRQLFEIEYSQIGDHTNLLQDIADQLRYANPVSYSETFAEDEKLKELINGLSALSSEDMENRLREISKTLKIRKIKQEGAEK